MCARDVLFYFNTFLFTYDPRKSGKGKIMPFVTWDYQNECIVKVVECAENGDDLVFEKTRDMGATWLCQGVGHWKWMFHDMEALMFVTRNEYLVDKKGNPNTLFWKFDFMTDHLPAFMQPRVHRTHMHMENLETGSVIDGESCTGDMGRGGRSGMFFVDEFAAMKAQMKVRSAVRDNSKCTIYNSTPNGAANQHYEITHDGHTEKITMHWSRHPDKGRGLYEVGGESIKILDEEYTFPVNYKFVNQKTSAPHPLNKLRSPWYDEECVARGNIKVLIGQNIDISYEGSASQYFDEDKLDAYRSMYVRDPIIRGDCEYDPETHEDFRVRQGEEGSCQLWFDPGNGFKVPSGHTFVIGIDIAAGTGASLSVITVWDCNTREKLLEYANAYIVAHKLAWLAIAIGKWFSDGAGTPALMLWERNGVGRNFGDAVIEVGYSNMYFQREEKKISKKIGKMPGWWRQGAEADKALLGGYRKALEENEIIDRSHWALKECSRYIYMPTGHIVHDRAMDVEDPSGARDNHGDRVVASALGYKAMREISIDKTRAKPVYRENTLGARREAQEKRRTAGRSELIW